jgi:hypothetical protein
MATLGHLSRLVEPQVAVIPGKYGTGGLIASAIVAVDGQGFDRVCHNILTGTMAAGAGFDAEITESATAAGSYTLIANSGMAAIVGSTGAKKIIMIDVPVNSAKPFQKIRATASTTGTTLVSLSAIALCYGGSGTKPTTAEDVKEEVYKA